MAGAATLLPDPATLGAAGEPEAEQQQAQNGGAALNHGVSLADRTARREGARGPVWGRANRIASPACPGRPSQNPPRNSASTRRSPCTAAAAPTRRDPVDTCPSCFSKLLGSEHRVPPPGHPAYCGLAWDDRRLGYHQTERPVHTASAMQVRQPIYRNAVGRWRAYEEFLAPLLAALLDVAVPEQNCAVDAGDQRGDLTTKRGRS
jgi:hypothetical protein